MMEIVAGLTELTRGYYWVKMSDEMPWEVAFFADQYPGWFLTGDSAMFSILHPVAIGDRVSRDLREQGE